MASIGRQPACAKEQVLVEATRMAKEADAGLDSARRQVEVKMNELRTLSVPLPSPSRNRRVETESANVFADVTLVSPMAGTVEERLVATSERVSAGDTIYVVADTSQLWAVAQLRQRDWQAISIQPGTRVTIQSPALKESNLSSRSENRGSKGRPVTGSMPIIACLNSPMICFGQACSFTLNFRPGRVEMRVGCTFASCVNTRQSKVCLRQSTFTISR